MAKRVVELVEGSEPTPKFVYELTDSIEDKIGKIVRTIYGGDGVTSVSYTHLICNFCHYVCCVRAYLFIDSKRG